MWKTLVCSFGINLISLILSFNQTKIFQESETISSLYLMIGTNVWLEKLILFFR